MNKLILFDIDKTLIKSSSGHKVAFSEAFKKVYGIDTNIGIINHHGMTEMVESYKKVSEKDEVILLNDVKETLDALRKKGDILFGLVTGNLEPIARSKLKKVKIDNYFLAGGFGSDDINRTNLVRLAVKRAENKFNVKFDIILLVGDAPLDMKAGKEVKIKTVGVTTGIYTKEELEKAGADYVIENLKGLLEIVE